MARGELTVTIEADEIADSVMRLLAAFPAIFDALPTYVDADTAAAVWQSREALSELAQALRIEYDAP